MIAPVVDVDICLGREYGYWNPARYVDARVSTEALPGCLHPERARYVRGMCRSCVRHERRWGRYHLYPTRRCPMSGKRCWPSYERAVTGARKADPDARVYRCDGCGLFHVTSGEYDRRQARGDGTG